MVAELPDSATIDAIPVDMSATGDDVNMPDEAQATVGVVRSEKKNRKRQRAADAAEADTDMPTADSLTAGEAALSGNQQTNRALKMHAKSKKKERKRNRQVTDKLADRISAGLSMGVSTDYQAIGGLSTSPPKKK